MKHPASIMRQRFVEEYVAMLCPNAKEAAIRAGYSPRTAKQTGYKLLKNPAIEAEIKAASAARVKRIRMSADDVLVGLAEIASVDPVELVDENDSLLPLRKIPAHVRRAIASIEFEGLYGGRGKNRKIIGRNCKVKLWDKKGALDTLAKHHTLLTERIIVTDPDGKAAPMFQIVFESPKEKP